MPVAIRLMRFGKKGHPSYRIVALDKRKKRDGAYIEKIGLYDPLIEPLKLEINQERLSYWLGVGAEVSEGMIKLMKRYIKVKQPQPKPKKATKALKTPQPSQTA